jgi:hypothetical protein
MIKLSENNPQGTANIVDDRVLATVRVKCVICSKIVAGKKNGYDISMRPRKHKDKNGNDCEGTYYEGIFQ